VRLKDIAEAAHLYTVSLSCGYFKSVYRVSPSEYLNRKRTQVGFAIAAGIGLGPWTRSPTMSDLEAGTGLLPALEVPTTEAIPAQVAERARLIGTPLENDEHASGNDGLTRRSSRNVINRSGGTVAVDITKSHRVEAETCLPGVRARKKFSRGRPSLPEYR